MTYKLFPSLNKNSVIKYVEAIPVNSILEVPSLTKPYPSLEIVLLAIQSLKAGRIIKLPVNLSESKLKMIAEKVNPGVMVYLSEKFNLDSQIQLDKYLNSNCVMCLKHDFNKLMLFMFEAKPTRLLKLHGAEPNKYFKYVGEPNGTMEYIKEDDPLLMSFSSAIEAQLQKEIDTLPANLYSVLNNSQQVCSLDIKKMGLMVPLPQSNGVSTEILPVDQFVPIVPMSVCSELVSFASSEFERIFMAQDEIKSMSCQIGGSLAGTNFMINATPAIVDELLPALPHLNRYLSFSIIDGDVQAIKKLMSALPSYQIVDLSRLPEHLKKNAEEFSQCLSHESFIVHGLDANLCTSEEHRFLNQLPDQVKLIHNKPCFPPASEQGKKIIKSTKMNEIIELAKTEQTEKKFLNKITPINSIQSLTADQNICILEDLSLEQVNGFSRRIKKIHAGFNLSPDFLKLLAQRNIQICYPKHIGISQKYLNFRMLTLTPFHEDKAASPSGEHANADVPTSFVNSVEWSVVCKDKKNISFNYLYHHRVHNSDIELDYYASQPIEDPTQAVTYVYAGRGEKALIPLSKSTLIILVITKDEFEKLPIMSLKNIGILVISHIRKPYKEIDDPIHTISSRRYASLYFSYEMNLEKILMHDDNIEKIFSHKVTGEDTQDDVPSLDDVIVQLNNELIKTASLFISVPSRSYVNKFTDGKYGSKCHLWDLKNIRNHLNTKESFLALMPEHATVWGQVIFAQVLLDIVNPGQQATRIIRRNMLQLQRASTNRNATQKLGVYAKCLEFTSNYENYLKSVLSPDLFNKIEAAHISFNQMVMTTIQSEEKRLEKMQTMELEQVHAQRNGLMLKSISPAPVNDSFQENFKRHLQALLAYRDSISQFELQPHEHQWQSIEFLIERLSLDPSFSNALFEIATGCGKTFIQAMVAFVALASTDKSIVVVCPYRHLTEQTYNAFIEYFRLFAFFSSELNMSSSKIIKVYSGSDTAFPQEVIAQNLCPNPRYIYMTCEDSFYQLMECQKFKDNIALTLFDESHLTVHDKHVAPSSSASSSSSNSSMTLYFTATARASMPHTFTFPRETGIERNLLSPLLVDKLPEDLELTNEKILYLLEQHREPNGQKLMDSKGIVFVKSQRQAQELKRFIQAKYPNYPCFQISSENTEHLNHIKQFKAAPQAIGIAVNMLIEGFDHGALRWILLLRKTDPIRLSQIIGRILRLDPLSPNKIGLLIAGHDVLQDSIFPSHRKPPANYQSAATCLRHMTENQSNIMQVDDFQENCFSSRYSFFEPMLSGKKTTFSSISSNLNDSDDESLCLEPMRKRARLTVPSISFYPQETSQTINEYESFDGVEEDISFEDPSMIFFPG